MVTIPYTRQSITEEDRHSVSEALKHELITRGPQVEAFEKAIANYCGASYAVAFNSASTALYAACFAGGITQYDRLIVSANTFIASAGCAQGAIPVFIDIDRKTGNFNLEQVGYTLQKPFSRGRPFVMAVHFAGIANDMQALDKMVSNPESIVIEDAAHAIGSEYVTGEKVGSCAYSHMTVFSFHPAKVMTTGEGGIVTTNDPALFHRLQLYRNNGIERDQSYLTNPGAMAGPGYYEVHATTGNFHMTEMQAALGLSQFSRLDAFIKKRRQLVKLYRKLLKNTPNILLFDEEADARSAYHLFVAQIDFNACNTTREHVMQALKEKGIGTQVHYIPLYRHPYYADKMGDVIPYFPEMEKYYAQALSLPLYFDLTEGQVEMVVKELKGILKQK